MPDNQIPATQSEAGAAPGEFNFDKPETENPRIKRRSLKAKPTGLIKPSGLAISAARDLEREAPSLSAGQSQAAQPKSQAPAPAKSVSVVAKAADAPVAPPRTTLAASTTSSRPASGSAAAKSATTSSSTSSQTTSPHGTRPATLYYSSNPRKDKEAPSPMKTIPTSGQPSASASSTSTASATTPLRTSAATTAASAVRPSTTASARPAGTIDYRANVERQTREQKSVGNILSYVVYGLIGFFVISAGLAGYGTKVIFDRLHDQSMTVSDLDARYAAATKDLNAKLATSQDTLSQAQAQITRQQALIVSQQEELNRLIAATNDNVNALKLEKQARTQETSALRARVKDLENREALLSAKA